MHGNTETLANLGTMLSALCCFIDELEVSLYIWWYKAHNIILEEKMNNNMYWMHGRWEAEVLYCSI